MPEPWAKGRWGKRWSMLKGLVAGEGFFENISDAYKFLMGAYEDGDKVFLFGFSRGAYTARAVAALLHSIGLLHRDSECLVPYALRYWQSDFGPNSPGGATCAEFKATLSRPCPVHFVGVWDTVGSVGFVNYFKSFPHITHNPEVEHLRHAVSVDERRSTFRQNLAEPINSQDIEDVFFAGVHSDVGGGYEPSESGLAKIAFAWIVREARTHGLDVDQDAFDRELNQVGEEPNPQGGLHRSLQGGWWILELLPYKRYSWQDRRWHWHWLIGGFNQPRDIRRLAGKSFVAIHQSLLDRLNGQTMYRPVNLPSTEAEIRSMFRIEQ
jgi:uncharacterized protein (DUF2235 family)